MLSVLDKLKKTKTTIEYHNVGIFPNSNRKIVERVKIDTLTAHTLPLTFMIVQALQQTVVGLN
jgi:hypothetical protein